MGRNKTRKPDVPTKSKLKKDPGVPRLPVLKQRVRQTDGRGTALALAAAGAAAPAARDPDTPMASEPTLGTLAALAADAEASAASASAAVLGEEDGGAGTGAAQTREQARRHYVRALHKVLEEADIILLVLDARDPDGCRSRLVEEEVRRREADGKRLVFVLNKIDLVPKENAQAWLRHLRHSTPTLPFRSASNGQRSNLSSSTAPALMRLLKAFKPSARSATVGVVGYPNVGKSSLINALKRSKVCAVASTPGHTRELQSIALERGLRIVDSPGVVFDDADLAPDGHKTGARASSVLLRNVVRVEDVPDPVEVVEAILERTPAERVQTIYGVPPFADARELLTMLALTSGRLLKGGTPDILAAARIVLHDWNAQKIPYFTEPPAIHPSLLPSVAAATGAVALGAETTGQAQILSTLGRPFELAGLFAGADAGAFGARDPATADADMDGADGAPPAADMDGVLDEMAMASDDLAHLIGQKRSRSPSPSAASAAATAPSSPMRRAPSPGGKPHAPKRLRRNPAREDGAPAAPAAANPLGRRALKAGAKRAKRDERRRWRAVDGGEGMEVDEGGLEGTFMA